MTPDRATFSGRARIAHRLVLLVLLCASCGDRRDASSKDHDPHAKPGTATTQTATPPAPPTPTTLALDARTQYDLVADIVRSEGKRDDDADVILYEVRQSWLGKRFRWQVFYVPVLCRDAKQCHVMPFDRAGEDKRIVQGFLPRLALPESALASLRARCAGQARCAFRFEGTLSQLVLSTEHLTRLQFSDVVLVPGDERPATGS